MAINPVSAIGAYAKQARLGGVGGMEPRNDPVQSFGDLVSSAAQTALETGRKSEQLSAAAVAGKADTTDVVTAVTNAEITLQTVLAVRDRVIQAYQDIMRMPI
jgi:flagellar hook-basal body complex protein FliE